MEETPNKVYTVEYSYSRKSGSVLVTIFEDLETAMAYVENRYSECHPYAQWAEPGFHTDPRVHAYYLEGRWARDRKPTVFVTEYPVRGKETKE